MDDRQGYRLFLQLRFSDGIAELPRKQLTVGGVSRSSSICQS